MNAKVGCLFATALAVACAAPEPVAPNTLALKQDHYGDGSCRPATQGDASSDSIVFYCSIAIPSPLTGSQKGWVEQSNGKYFLTDYSASGVHVIDIRTHTYAGFIGGMAGNAATGGGTATTNGPGPNAFVSVPRRYGFRGQPDPADRGGGPDRVLFASDGNSTVRVINMETLQVIASISTASPACDDGTATGKYCGRSNEIAYDPVHHIVLVSNPAPLTLTAPHILAVGYATFISAEPPYTVLGRVTFPGAGNVEGHIWVPQLNRFLLPIQPTAANQATKGTMYIAVINPRTLEIEDKRVYFCPEIPGTIPTSTGNNNLQLAPEGNLWAQMCGRPIRLDVFSGAIKNVVSQVGTGDQDWYNPGDGNFYVTGAVPPADPSTTPPTAAGPAQLGVIDGRSGAFLQSVANPGGASPSAYARTNEIFTRVPYTAANDPNSRCTVKGTGCVAVFGHSSWSR